MTRRPKPLSFMVARARNQKRSSDTVARKSIRQTLKPSARDELRKLAGQRGHELEALVALQLDPGHFVFDENAAPIPCEMKAEFAGYNLASPSPLRRQRAGRPLPREVAHPTRFERAACGVIPD